MTTPRDSAPADGVLDDADELTLNRLAELYSVLDPVPAGLIDRITFGMTLDALHAEVAELQRSADLVGVRSDSATEAQTVTFTSSQLSIMITISPLSADRARIDGWVVPGAGVSVEIRSVNGTLACTADADGRFVFEDVARGLAQFRVQQPGDDPRPSVITPSLEI